MDLNPASMPGGEFSILEDEIVVATSAGSPSSAASASAEGAHGLDHSSSFDDPYALCLSRMQTDFEEGQPPSPVPAGGGHLEPEPEPEPEPEVEVCRRDMLGYFVEDGEAGAWQVSPLREKAHAGYIADRNKLWLKEAGRYSAANLHEIPVVDMQRYRVLYREGFFTEGADNPGHVQLLHDVATGKRADLVRKGVPPSGQWGRGCVWQLHSGALTKHMQFPEMYASLCEICAEQAEADKKQGEFAVGDSVVVVEQALNTEFIKPGQAGTVHAIQGEGEGLRVIVRASADDFVQSRCEADRQAALAEEREPPPQPAIATGTYQPADLKPASLDEAHRQVELDLHRTIPQHDGMTDIIPALRRVLLAYAYRNSAVGYCQSMNFLAAHILLHVEETPAFWLLTTLVEDILPPAYFERGMIGVRVDVGVCEDLIAVCLPKLAEHLTSMDCYTFGLRGLLTQWLMTQFVTALPPETVGRVWDSLFYVEGDRIFFRVVVALFRRLEKQLLALSVPTDAATLLREETAALFNGKALMDLCFDRKMKRFDDEAGRQNIEDCRAVRRQQVEAEAAEMAERRAAHNAKRQAREQERALTEAAEAEASSKLEEASGSPPFEQGSANA